MRIFHLCAALALAAASQAATSTAWELNTYQDFVRGKLDGLSLTRDGRLTLAPKVETLFTSEQPEIWSVARAVDGSLYLGTGHRGRVYRVDPAGKASLLWTSDQPEVFAVAVDKSGSVYAATSPDGKIYRIQDGKAAEYFAPGARYVWALAVAADGTLYAGTGDQGKIWRITGAGQGEVYYETGQSNVTCLALDREGRLLAGSEPNGLLYRITAKDKAFVLYDANLPEIRSIVPMPDGSVYAAALGGSVAKRTNAAAGASAQGNQLITVPGTTITVTDAQAGLELKPKPDPNKSAAASTVQTAATAGTSTVEYAGVEKSALYRINADNTVETLWTSKEENIYDVLASGTRVLFGTDGQGRIYRLTADHKTTLVAQTNEGETTRLLDVPEGILATTGSMGKLLRLTPEAGSGGIYESPVHDASTVARWGRINWRGDLPSGATLTFSTRSGNAARPDATWSDWSAPAGATRDGVPVKSPNARYIQWRAELHGDNSAVPMVDSVSVAYLPQNTPPTVRSINVTFAAGSASSKSTGTPAASTSPYSITVTDSGESSAAAGTPTQTLTRSASQQTQIVWQADDPDGDRLVYALYFRGEEEREWKLLRANMSENSLSLDSDILADGRYFFRVVASDRPSNPPAFAKDAELVSAPVLIDNTPPVVTASAPRRNGNVLDIDVEAADQTSPLRRCEYSIDASPWVPMEARDGVTDSLREQFQVHVETLRAGEHLVVIRAYDSAGNAGLAKVVVR